MTTPLGKPLRRALTIGGDPWVVTIAPAGLRLTRKGRRKGIELGWPDLVNGDAALAAALNASLRGGHLALAGRAGPSSRRGGSRSRPKRS